MAGPDPSERKSPEHLAQVKRAIEAAKGLLSSKGRDAEGFMVSIHILKEGRLEHTFSYEDFKDDDWGNCMIAMGVEAQRARTAGTDLEAGPRV